MKLREPKVYRTQDLDFSAYLIMEGIKFLSIEVEGNIAYLLFDNAKSNILDLERVFLNTDVKKFCSIRKYLLREVHKSIKESKKDN